MKTHLSGLRQNRSGRSGFTLIELLIVIVIIAILASASIPVGGIVREQLRRTEAKNEVKNIITAISLYKLEYGKLPFKSGGGGQDIEFDTEIDDLIAMLSGFNIDGLNPREKKFYEGKNAKNSDTTPIGGTYGRGENIRLADPWGNPYYIKLDSDYDGGISELPGLQGDEIRKDAVAWSQGKPIEKDSDEFAPPAKWITTWQ